MRPLIAVGGIAAERHQRGANVVSGRYRRMGVTEVVAEQVAAYGQVVVAGRFSKCRDRW